MDKPAKPYPDFPLFPHATGRWAKKIRGKLVYFGPWRDPNGALRRYLEERDELHAGLVPTRDTRGKTTVRDLVNHFLTAKKRLVDAGELSALTHRDYRQLGVRLVGLLGRTTLVDALGPDDFDRLRSELAAGVGPVTTANRVIRTRSMFRYGFEVGLMAAPPRFGPHFKKPSERVMRQSRNDRGPMMFNVSDLHRMLKASPPPMRAMILLGINCGFGNTDVATVPPSAFMGGWVDYPRPKTSNPRRCPLWPETVEAIEAQRPPYRSAHGTAFRELITRLGLYRPGLGFYTLRRTFETVAGDSLDQVAVDFIMGHIALSRDMSARYRQQITDDRLVAVAEHVHRWLFQQQP